MKKRFVVALDSAIKEQDEAFKEYVRSRGLGWWHWLTNLWLLTDASGQLTASEIRDVLTEIYPRVHALVLELRGDDDTWSGIGPKTEKRNMFKWLHKNW